MRKKKGETERRKEKVEADRNFRFIVSGDRKGYATVFCLCRGGEKRCKKA